MTAPATGARRVPVSLLWVGGGIGVYGLASFAFLPLAARGLGSGPDYTALTLVWTLLNAVGIGLYLPLEQHGGRSVSARLARGEATRPALRGPLVYTAASLAVLALAALALDGPLTSHVFDDVPHMTGALVLALAGMSVAYLARGVLAGTGRFPRYGLQLALDGLLRVAGAGVLAAAGVTDARAYALALALAPVASTLLSLTRPQRLLTPGGPGAPGVHETGMVALVAASLASQALANAGPVAAQLLRAPDETRAAADLVNALMVSRVPLFLFAAVQAVFLPRLAALVAQDDRAAFVRVLRLATVATAAIGALGVAAMTVVGPQALRLLFPGFGTRLDVLVLLALSGSTFMVVQVLVQALLARHGDRTATVAWCAGLAVMALALVPAGDVQTRVALAMTAGSAGALAVAAVGLARTMARWPVRETAEVTT